MSTQHFISKQPQRISLPAFSLFPLFSGFFIVLLLALALCSTAFAASSSTLLDAPPTDENVARAGVSVVRLLVTYAITTTPDKIPSTTQCTGLGVLVNSRPSQSSSDQNTSILTDGSLLNTSGQITCTATHIPATLATVQIFFSTLYNPNPPSIMLPSGLIQDIHCRSLDCSQGPALLSFNENVLQPYVDVATTTTATSQQVSLGLTKSASSLEVPISSSTGTSQIQPYLQSIQQHLTPHPVLAGSTTIEDGTPVVNTSGQLVSMHLNGTGAFTFTDITAFLSPPQIQPGANPVHDNWNTGITAFYQQKNFNSAQSAFQQAAATNSQFQAARDFQQFSHDRLSNTTPPAPSSGIVVNGRAISFTLIAIVGALVLLIVLLLLASVFFGRSRLARRQAAKAEYAEIERRAAIDAQRIAEMEAAQRTWPEQSVPPPPPPHSPPLPMSTLHCPRCNEVVQRDASYCPNCRAPLSPSISGLHFINPPQAPVSGVIPVSSLADQPTLDMSSTDQPTLDMTSADQPTAEISPSQNGLSDAEKTLPYSKPKSAAKHLSLLVSTRTDPGIKRKFKPNEDSLFAGQGARKLDAALQQVGLFVVADGMGGHANGQDASRMAIQNIIDYILPKLFKNGEVDHNALQQLLVDGVQNANQAVHQQNMAQQGDMGTTMTAALIIDNMAYIANVGDSRTYLYRPSQGLAKITQDHSVVASLVEAGIIQPDDIYTHPKRNQIYRSLGEKPAVEIDSFPVQLQPGDELLLCSDGLWDMVRDPQIEEVFKTPSPNLERTGDALIQAALDGGGDDNVSVIIVQVAESGKRTNKPGFKLLAKPDIVHLPTL